VARSKSGKPTDGCGCKEAGLGKAKESHQRLVAEPRLSSFSPESIHPTRMCPR
jgi:hypothetical protein